VIGRVPDYFPGRRFFRLERRLLIVWHDFVLGGMSTLSDAFSSVAAAGDATIASLGA
jgi:hypothetical protein